MREFRPVSAPNISFRMTEAAICSLVNLLFGDGQGDLACCGSWGRKELDMTERLN